MNEHWDWVDELSEPWPVAVAIVAILILCVVAATAALAQETQKRGVLFNCLTLAQAVGGVAVYRDVGADQAKTIAMLRAKNAWLGGSHLQALEREIRRMWREGLTPEEAEFALYKRCEAQIGDMGREG